MKKHWVMLMLFSLPIFIIVIAVIRRVHNPGPPPEATWFDQLPTPTPGVNTDSLKKMGAAAVPVLRQKLKSNDARDRLRAAWALALVGASATNAIPDLVEATDDPDMAVSAYAIDTLKNLGDVDTNLVPKLMTKLTDPRMPVSDGAYTLLDKIQQDQVARGAPKPVGDEEYAIALVNATSQRVALEGLKKLKKLPQGDERVASAVNSVLNSPNDWLRRTGYIILKGQLPPTGTNAAPTVSTNLAAPPPQGQN